jgi:hypothetical protein
VTGLPNDESLNMSSESDTEFTSGTSSPAVSSPIPMPQREQSRAGAARSRNTASRRYGWPTASRDSPSIAHMSCPCV